jgi:hypothetical protein
VAKIDRNTAGIISMALLLLAVPAGAQQPGAVAPDEAAQAQSQQLDISDIVARDVLEPLQEGIQTQNLKQVISVFDAPSFSDFPQLRDRIKALLGSYAVLQFRYKILQITSDNGHASLICEVDLDATPSDDGQVPMRRSTQLRLQLKETPKAWRISAFAPSDFFAQ